MEVASHHISPRFYVFLLCFPDPEYQARSMSYRMIGDCILRAQSPHCCISLELARPSGRDIPCIFTNLSISLRPPIDIFRHTHTHTRACTRAHTRTSTRAIHPIIVNNVNSTNHPPRLGLSTIPKCPTFSSGSPSPAHSSRNRHMVIVKSKNRRRCSDKHTHYDIYPVVTKVKPSG